MKTLSTAIVLCGAMAGTGILLSQTTPAFEVAWDRVILALAQTEERIGVTADTDFGELAFRWRLPAESGVVLIRLDWKEPDSDNRVVVNALVSREDW